MATELVVENPHSLELCPLCSTELRNEEIEQLPCCNSSVCSDCAHTYLQVRIESGQHEMPCPLGVCEQPLPLAFLERFLSETLLHRLELLQINAQQSHTRRSCPSCTHIMQLSEKTYKQMKSAHSRAKDSARVCQVLCEGCNKPWCYYCYGPAHPGISCSENRDDDLKFARWTKDWDRMGNQQNAFRCPKCHIPIQRDGGCSSMTCTKCNCYWCYNCGKEMNAPASMLLGSHGSNKWEVNACDSYKILGGKRVTKALRWLKVVHEVFIFSICGVAIFVLLLPFLPILVFLAPPALFLLYSARKLS